MIIMISTHTYQQATCKTENKTKKDEWIPFHKFSWKDWQCMNPRPCCSKTLKNLKLLVTVSIVWWHHML